VQDKKLAKWAALVVGRELCCSTWLTDFKSVNTAAARYQNLSINQTKLSGQCGRLKCCLNYELDTYLDALQNFPDNCDQLQVAKGNAYLVKKDIFKNLMWYTLPDSNKQYPLSIERVGKIKTLNKQGVIPEELEPVELTTSKPEDIEPEYVDLVGQISLKSLDKAADKKRRQNQQQRGQRPQQRQQAGGQQQQGNRGPQAGGGQQNQQPNQGNAGQPRQQGGQQQRPQRNQPGRQGGNPRNQQGGNQQRPNNPNRQGGGNPNNPRNQQRPDSPNEGK
jgi:hypothetical protein